MFPYKFLITETCNSARPKKAAFYEPVEKCWAFTDSAFTSAQEQLLKIGVCTRRAGQA